MLRFANQILLYLLLLLPVLVLFYYFAFRAKTKALQRFGNLELLQKLIKTTSRKRQMVKIVLLLTAVLFMVLALARPQIGTRFEEVKREGVDIFIALDVSTSMLAQDIQPDRLSKAKYEVEKLIDLFEGDRVGLIAFAGVAFVQCPLTLDYGAAKIFLDIIDPDLIPTPGTAISDAIKKAIDAFESTERKHKVLILITDGEDHSGDALKLAEEAEKQGIIIHCVGIGSPKGEPIPVDSNNSNDFKKDRQGNVVITKLDEVTLEKIALQTGGTYYRATGQGDFLEKIYEQIGKMEKKELGSRRFSQFEDRFQYLLIISLVLLVVEFLLSERKKVKGEWRGRFM